MSGISQTDHCIVQLDTVLVSYAHLLRDAQGIKRDFRKEAYC